MVALGDIQAAARRLAGIVRRTPLLNDPRLDAAAGGRVFVKAECLQRFGSFKIRGAYNCVAALAPEARAGGVVAMSSGNHAIAVAAAARMHGVPAHIVMPADAPATKRADAEAQGAKIVAYDRVRDDRDAIAAEVAAKAGGLPIVPPFDHPDTIAGQGTIGLEIAEELAGLGVTPDAAIAGASGGGLVTGCAVALRAAFPGIAVYAAEPAGHEDFARSLAAGERVANEAGVRSFADALLAPRPGVLPFALARTHLAGAVAATDAETEAAMAAAFRWLRLVVEPGGAVALGAVLAGRLKLEGRTAVVVVSGGNVDADLFAAVLGR